MGIIPVGDVALANGVNFGRPKQEITEDFKAAYKRWKAGEFTAVAAMNQE
ncbi:hypothetical protein [Brevibacillus sp. NRS-1366]